MAYFDLESYETVADRLKKYWADCPNGKVETMLLHNNDNQKQFVVQAFVYRDGGGTLWASGLAEEHFGNSGPNQSSPLENAETSAIGRALANAGYATTSDSRPSREEMEKVNRVSGDVPPGNPGGVQEVREQFSAAKSNSPKVDVADDSRWTTIQEGHAADPSNTFLKDLVEKGQKWGNLSEKQMGAGFNAARKALDSAPRNGNVVSVADVADAFNAEDAPF